MPYYMHQWTYKTREVRTLLEEPQSRADVVRIAMEAFGGKLHQFFFTFGEYDGVAISEFPDKETALACMMSIIGQGGPDVLKTTVLFTPEESQDAMKKAHDVVSPYTPPSGSTSDRHRD